jgi:hypothetical protein
MRGRIARRKRIFFACEGESEQSYGTLLHRLIEHEGHIHIDAIIPHGGGDPLSIVQHSIRVCKGRELRGSSYSAKAVLLDSDRMGENLERDRQIEPLARQHGLHIIWQKPCHEAFLLRHIASHHARRPATSKEALDTLIEAWPDYQKGSPTTFLLKYIGLDEIALACKIEVEFASLLNFIRYFS